MSIATEITRLQNAKSSIKTAIEGKGVEVPSTTKLDGYGELITSIPSGGGYEEGNLTTTSRIKQIEISHNLGVVPRGIVFWCTDDISNWTNADICFNSSINNGNPKGVCWRGNYAATLVADSADFTSSTITIDTYLSTRYPIAHYHYLIY